MAEIIDGKALAQALSETTKAEVEAIRAAHGITPGLAVKLAEYARRLHATALEIQNHATGNPAPAPAP